MPTPKKSRRPDKRPKKPRIRGQAARIATWAFKKQRNEPDTRRKVAGSAAYFLMEKYGIGNPKDRKTLYENMQKALLYWEADKHGFSRCMRSVNRKLRELGLNQKQITRFFDDYGRAMANMEVAIADTETAMRVLAKRKVRKIENALIKQGIRKQGDVKALKRLIVNAMAAETNDDFEHFNSRIARKLNSLGLTPEKIGRLSEELNEL